MNNAQVNDQVYDSLTSPNTENQTTDSLISPSSKNQVQYSLMSKNTNISASQNTDSMSSTILDIKTPPPKVRLECLDVFRGLTMAGMIMVNNQGDYESALWPFSETQWNGITTADMVFPSFLFINGMSIYLALKPEMGRKPDVWLKLFKRAAILFTIGLYINFQDTNFHITQLRVLGVLQRTAICYLIVSIIRLTIKETLTQIMVILIFPLLYLVLMFGVDIPQCGKGNLTPECNTGAYVDQKIFGSHHMMYPNDPEGIVSTLNSVCTIYMGLIYMQIFQKEKIVGKELIKQWSVLSCYIVFLSILLQFWMPYNKKIWSISFLLLTSGISGFVLLLSFIFVDFYKNPVVQKLKQPFIWLGMNPLFIYVAMELVEALFAANIQFEYNGDQTSLWSWLFDVLLFSWIPSKGLCTTIYATIHLIFWTWVSKIMYDNKIFLKI